MAEGMRMLEEAMQGMASKGGRSFDDPEASSEGETGEVTCPMCGGSGKASQEDAEKYMALQGDGGEPGSIAGGGMSGDMGGR